jgi:hypothetical protein
MRVAFTSDSPKLHVSIEKAHEALLEAPQDEKVRAIATATITHDA